ncbi:uncharacterized protein ATNIH1004_007268 [Aspergillus tanneri]|uniref:Uncharacterized protein n=1 Tax=Aspergillus tanneri TaxID=1220188 RepID=A0A5M9MTL5_9EURO|nr:uncharacterized protein ATNIH1004_007268 [Aspergillus tanneri]KAA8645847.1 hypothetical protein ATNIH1004_007268 [Aspergillus tanneri]
MPRAATLSVVMVTGRQRIPNSPCAQNASLSNHAAETALYVDALQSLKAMSVTDCVSVHSFQSRWLGQGGWEIRIPTPPNHRST